MEKILGTCRIRRCQSAKPVKTKQVNESLERWANIHMHHRRRVASARPVVDSSPPIVYAHQFLNQKKLQREAELIAIIERDNRILLDRMAHTMRAGSLVDNRWRDHKYKSLNQVKRQRELLRITHENLAILRKLSCLLPNYNHKKWLLEHQVNQQYMVSRSQYTHPWRDEQIPLTQLRQRVSSANKRVHTSVRTHSRLTERERPATAPASYPARMRQSDHEDGIAVRLRPCDDEDGIAVRMV